jgi:hypothetical protein
VTNPKRREFTRAVKVAIRKRATRNGVRYCEICGTQAMRGDVHHKKQDAMEVSKRRKLKPEDGLYVCKPCHAVETKRQAAELALVLGREASHYGVKKVVTAKIARREPEPKKPLKLALGPPGLARRGFIPARSRS